MRPALLALLVASGLSAGQGTQTFTGLITDDMCPMGDHSRMQMGPTDADCARACAMAHASPYVLFDGKTVYRLSDQHTPEQLAAQKVRVVGALDAKTMTIRVESMTAVRQEP